MYWINNFGWQGKPCPLLLFSHTLVIRL